MSKRLEAEERLACYYIAMAYTMFAERGWRAISLHYSGSIMWLRNMGRGLNYVGTVKKESIEKAIDEHLTWWMGSRCRVLTDADHVWIGQWARGFFNTHRELFAEIALTARAGAKV